AACVDDLFHLLAAEVTGLAGAKDPFDGVDDVRLARTVGADDGGHSAVELDLGLPGKGFEAQQLQGLEEQDWRGAYQREAALSPSGSAPPGGVPIRPGRFAAGPPSPARGEGNADLPGTR